MGLYCVAVFVGVPFAIFVLHNRHQVETFAFDARYLQLAMCRENILSVVVLGVLVEPWILNFHVYCI